MRAVLERLLALLLRIFFRRVEVVGEPPEGPAVYVLNHPNALVDPLFILCMAPQRVAFLAKAPLFRMPVIGWMVRALGCLPVYRRQDGADTGGNQATLEAARETLAAGGAVALFPEGTSHSDPALKPLKTGAARIALAANAGAGPPVPVVPVGLCYTAKGIFRSAALLRYGAPIAARRVELDERLEPPREAARELTEEIDTALRVLVPQAENAEALDLCERAERIFAAAGEERAASLDERTALRQRFLQGYRELRRRERRRVDRVARRIERYEGRLRALGLSVDHPEPELLGSGAALRFAAQNALALFVGAPLGLAGIVLHTPAYQIIRWLSLRLSRGPELPATIKLLGALLLFPITWGAAAAVAGAAGGPAWALAALAAGPLLGWLGLRFKERLENVGGAARALFLFLTRRRLFAHLAEERRAIRAEIEALAAL